MHLHYQPKLRDRTGDRNDDGYLRDRGVGGPGEVGCDHVKLRHGKRHRKGTGPWRIGRPPLSERWSGRPNAVCEPELCFWFSDWLYSDCDVSRGIDWPERRCCQSELCDGRRQRIQFSRRSGGVSQWNGGLRCDHQPKFRSRRDVWAHLCRRTGRSQHGLWRDQPKLFNGSRQRDQFYRRSGRVQRQRHEHHGNLCNWPGDRQ